MEQPPVHCLAQNNKATGWRNTLQQFLRIHGVGMEVKSSQGNFPIPDRIQTQEWSLGAPSHPGRSLHLHGWWTASQHMPEASSTSTKNPQASQQPRGNSPGSLCWEPFLALSVCADGAQLHFCGKWRAAASVGDTTMAYQHEWPPNCQGERRKKERTRN